MCQDSRHHRTSYSHPPAPSSLLRIMMTAQPAAKCTSTMSRGILGTLVSSSASSAKSANKFPNGDNIHETHANFGTKETSDGDMDGLMSTLEIYSGADYLFEGFAMVPNGSTKSYLEAALATPTEADRSVTSGRSAEAFHQHNCSIPTSYILLYNHSKVDVFCNPTFLSTTLASYRILNLRCNTGTIPVNQVGDLPGYGRMWYHPNGISNILELSNVADNDKYCIRYDSQDSKDCIVTRIKEGRDTHFRTVPRCLH